MDTTLVFALGMIGALAPEVVRLYSIRNNPRQFKWSRFYLVVSTLFACLGGVIAVTLPTTTYWGALYVGVSTPVFVNKILERGAQLSRPDWKIASEPYEKATFFQSFLRGL
jgi:Zn-dependent protease